MLTPTTPPPITTARACDCILDRPLKLPAELGDMRCNLGFRVETR
jgi:hypothetical protein